MPLPYVFANESGPQPAAQLDANFQAVVDLVPSAGTGLGLGASPSPPLSVLYGTSAGTAAQGNDARIVGALQKAANLSDLTNVITAVSNLGLTGALIAIDPCNAPFNAVGNGVADDSVALTSAATFAAANGYWLDGRGRTYGVNGVAGANNRWKLPVTGLMARRFSIIDINPNHEENVCIQGNGAGSGTIVLEDIFVNRNGDGTHGGINVSYGLQLGNPSDSTSGYSNIVMKGITATGNNRGGGIRVLWSSNIYMSRIATYNINFFHTVETDDQVQGVALSYCANAFLDDISIHNMGYTDQTTIYRYNLSRGLVLNGCQRIVVSNITGFGLAQWIDLSGSPYNFNITIVNGSAKWILANGVKFANTPVGVNVANVIVEQCGGRAFTFGAPAELLFNPTANIVLTNCVSRNAGTFQVPAARTSGFESIGSFGVTAFGQSPKNIQINGCSAISDIGAAPFTVSDTNSLLMAAPYFTMSQGVRCRLTTTGTLPSPLATATDYFLVPELGGNLIGLATSLVNAIDGVVISGYTGGSGTHTLTLQQDMQYGAYLSGYTGFDRVSPPSISNFHVEGATIAATSGWPQPLAVVSRAVSQATTTSTWTSVSPDTAQYDPLSLSSYATTAADFLPNQSRNWVITFGGEFVTNTTGLRKVKFQVDSGSGYVDTNTIDTRAPITGDTTTMRLSWTGLLATGWKIRVQVWQSSGGSLNFNNANWTFQPGNDYFGGV